VAEDEVILVDESDRELGTAPKLAAHREGALHRAFSVFLFNSRGETLLQRRADDKYHSGGLWTNTCCSHPRPGEETAAAASRRLREEMGLSTPLLPLFHFTYRAALGGGLWEHEYDHVFIGRADQDPRPDPAEVAAWRWASAEEVAREMQSDPDRFTIWFRQPFQEIVARRAWDSLQR
jgi:isopentenyl-diphosphate delta-isomerase